MVIDNVNVHHCLGAAANLGSGSKMMNSHAHHCGQIGLKAQGAANVTFDGVEVDHNHTDPGVPAWGWTPANSGGDLVETGGTKFMQTTGLAVRNCNFHDNVGPQLWLDYRNKSYLIESNRFGPAAERGIFLEVSEGGTVRDNTFTNVGADLGWVWGAALVVAASGGPGLEVTGNTLTSCWGGIVLIQQSRPGEAIDGTAALVRNVNVHDNTLTNSGVTGAAQDYNDATGNVFTRNNKFQANRYSGSCAWTWQPGSRSWAQWQAIPQDTTGSYTP
jgi:hypothetical protein